MFNLKVVSTNWEKKNLKISEVINSDVGLQSKFNIFFIYQPGFTSSSSVSNDTRARNPHIYHSHRRNVNFPCA